MKQPKSTIKKHIRVPRLYSEKGNGSGGIYNLRILSASTTVII